MSFIFVKEIVSFKQKEKESLGASWAYFLDLSTSSPNLALPDPMILQHFYVALSKDSTQFLDITSGGAFLHLSTSKGRTILNKILENTPYTSARDEIPKEEKESIPKQEEISIAESPPISSKDFSIDPEPQIPQILKEEEIHRLDPSFDYRANLY